MNIGLLGCGVVGGGILDFCAERADLSVTKVLVRRERPELGALAVTDIAAITGDSSIGIVVEVMGGLHPAYEYICAALEAGKHVVTANKAVISAFYPQLVGLAAEHGVSLRCTAAVGGGIPWLANLERCKRLDAVTELGGIMNGTTNFLMDAMHAAPVSFPAILKQAQELGYAEADPTADVEGIDAARKSCILSGLAFGKNVSPDEIHVEGISKVDALDAQFAEAGGMKIKLLGRTLVQSGKRFCFVSPHLVKSSALLAGVNDVFNAVCVRGSAVGEVLFAGPGAGRYPTASAVVGDIIDIVKNPGRMQPAGWEACAEKPADFSQFHARFYIRVPESEKEAMERQLGKITWLPARAGYLAGVTSPIEAGRAIGASPRPASAWPIFE